MTLCAHVVQNVIHASDAGNVVEVLPGMQKETQEESNTLRFAKGGVLWLKQAAWPDQSGKQPW